MSAAPLVESSRSAQAGSLAKSLLIMLGTWLAILVVIVVLWVALLRIFDVSPFVGKNPLDVYQYFFEGDDAAANRQNAWDLTWVTIGDAAIGFIAGMLAATVLAVIIVSSRVMEAAVMPLAMVVRSVPLVALAPIVIMAVGRGTGVVAVMGGIVVLFPALVTIVFGLRSVTPQMRDVVTVYGGSGWDVLRKVAFPTALPAFFSALRISVPGAFTGALLAEWLATGQGVGWAVVSAAARSQNTLVWALVVVITLVALAFYVLAQLAETLVLRRYDLSKTA